MPLLKTCCPQRVSGIGKILAIRQAKGKPKGRSKGKAPTPPSFTKVLSVFTADVTVPDGNGGTNLDRQKMQIICEPWAQTPERPTIAVLANWFVAQNWETLAQLRAAVDKLLGIIVI